MGFDTHILAATRLLNAQPAPSPTHPRLGRAGLTPWVAQIAIATSFGLAHLYGIPNGWIGISMAATWGFVLARLRLKTRGMLATYVTHVCADATIVAMLLPAVL